MLEAKREYEKDAEYRVNFFIADTYVQSTCGDKSLPDFQRTYACWRRNGARQKRSMDSIILGPAVKEMLLADCQDFLHSEDWYVHYLESAGM